MHVFIALCLLALQPTSLWGRSVAHQAHEAHGAWVSSSESSETSGASSRNNIAELLLPLIERGLSAEHSPKHTKKVIQVLPIRNSQEHSASWPKLNTRRKHVVEITPLRGKGRDGQPLAYILSPAKPNRRSRKHGNKHNESHKQRDHGNHQEKLSKDFDVSTVTKDVLDSSETYSESISSEGPLVEPSQERSESLSHQEQSVQVSAKRSESISEEEIVNPSEERIDSTYHEEETVQTSEETDSISQEEVVMQPLERQSENISHEQVVIQPLKERIESIIHEDVIVKPSEEHNSSEKNVVSSEDLSGSISYERNVVPPSEVHKESIMVAPAEHSDSISQDVTVELLKERNKRISSQQRNVEEEPAVRFSDMSANTVVESIGDEYNINFRTPEIDDDNADKNKEVVVQHSEEHSKSISDSEQVVKEALVSRDTVENTAIELVGDEYNRDVSDQDISIRDLVTSENLDLSGSDVIKRNEETIHSKDSSEPSGESHVERQRHVISDKRSNSNKNNQLKEPFDNRSDSNSKSEDTIIVLPHGESEYSTRDGHHLGTDINQHEDSNSEHPATMHDYSNQYVDYSKKSLAPTQLDVVSHHDDKFEISSLVHDTNRAIHKVHKGHHVINSAELKVSRNLDEGVNPSQTNHEEYEHIHHDPEKLSQSNINDDKGQSELSTIANTSYNRNVESDESHSEIPELVRIIGYHDGNVKTPHKHSHNRKENQKPMVEITVTQSGKQQKFNSENSEHRNLVQSDHLKDVHGMVAEVKQAASSSETERNVEISQRGVLNNIWEPHSADLIKLIQSSGERAPAVKDHGPCHTKHQNSNAHIHEHKSYRLSFLFNKK